MSRHPRKNTGAENSVLVVAERKREEKGKLEVG